MRIMISRMSVILIFLLVTRDSFAEDRPREYREGAYCKDISYVDTSTEGVEGTLECQAGASSGICIRHAECIKKDGSSEDRSGCQSLYIRDALNDNKGIHDQVIIKYVAHAVQEDFQVNTVTVM